MHGATIKIAKRGIIKYWKAGHKLELSHQMLNLTVYTCKSLLTNVQFTDAIKLFRRQINGNGGEGQINFNIPHYMRHSCF